MQPRQRRRGCRGLAERMHRGILRCSECFDRRLCQPMFALVAVAANDDDGHYEEPVVTGVVGALLVLDIGEQSAHVGIAIDLFDWENDARQVDPSTRTDPSTNTAMRSQRGSRPAKATTSSIERSPSPKTSSHGTLALPLMPRPLWLDQHRRSAAERGPAEVFNKSTFLADGAVDGEGGPVAPAERKRCGGAARRWRSDQLVEGLIHTVAGSSTAHDRPSTAPFAAGGRSGGPRRGESSEDQNRRGLFRVGELTWLRLGSQSGVYR